MNISAPAAWRAPLDQGRAAFNRGEFFTAHELWEEAWHQVQGPERLLIQGLIRIAAALHHLQQGRPRPAASLLAKGLEKLSRGVPAALADLPVDALAAELARLLAELESPEQERPLPRFPGCRMSPIMLDAASIRQITAPELKAMLDAGTPLQLLDVRTEAERAIARIEGARHLDEATVEQVASLPRDTLLVFQCHHGMRSQSAARHFVAQGFTNVCNLAGGIEAWSATVDPTVPRY